MPLGPVIARFLPWHGAGALLVVAGLCGALALQSHRLDEARRELAMAHARHQTDIATFKAAQARIEADWRAEIARTAARYRRQTDDADRQADADHRLYHERVQRLPAALADRCAADNAAMPAPGDPPRTDRSGDDSVLLARSDALICATNTARLRAAHDWALQIGVQPVPRD